ncbi:MAG: bifunctional folylpolyglutamate synthase/dihydrofolate synthase [Pirellulaceae bacterium]|jgi:dihydrofolate synthase/folylpolyglutamate synthase|nr:bifunctional folylpolyglutamate synthase/dihydrofolate synthase [Pirellulaceae bacterium]
MGSPARIVRDYESATAFLFGRINYERTRRVPYRSRRFKLDRMRQLAHRLGDPQRSFPAVHIAGTKGKGSTAVMMASVLSAAGYRTGLYTSPHLQRLEERFVVDGQPCDPAVLVDLLARIEPIVRDLDRRTDDQGDSQAPTYFEITTAAALLYFRDRQVDVAVLEVGLGGRLDSTNICHPVVSAITTISFDHTHILGNTLAAIAREKAGIIRPLVPVVTGVSEPEPREVIERLAAEQRTTLQVLGRDFDFDYHPALAGGTAAGGDGHDVGSCLDYREGVGAERQVLERVSLRLLGRHQAVNASVALAMCGQLRRAGWRVDEAAIRRGLQRAACPARVEIVSRSPDVILDAAHNPASVAALLDTLAERAHPGPRLLVFGTSADKDAAAMLAQLLPHFDHVVLTRYVNNPRGVEPRRLYEQARALQQQQGSSRATLHQQADPESAWRLARTLISPAHLVCVTGSFFLAAEIRPFIAQRQPAAASCS